MKRRSFENLNVALALFLRHYTLKRQVIFGGEPSESKTAESPGSPPTANAQTEVESKHTDGDSAAEQV